MEKRKVSDRSWFAQNIIYRRLILGLTGESLAEAADVHISVIRKIEVGKGEGNEDTQQKISRALWCKRKDLFDDPSGAKELYRLKKSLDKERLPLNSEATELAISVFPGDPMLRDFKQKNESKEVKVSIADLKGLEERISSLESSRGHPNEQEQTTPRGKKAFALLDRFEGLPLREQTEVLEIMNRHYLKPLASVPKRLPSRATPKKAR